MRESNPEAFKDYYLKQAQQKGGHLPAFNGAIMQRGYGLGSFLKGLYRWAVPHLHSGVKALGKQALKEGVGVAQDVLNGESVGDSLMKRGKKAIGSISNDTQNAPQAGGEKKTKKRKSKAKPISRPSAKKRKTSQAEPFGNFWN